MPLPKFPPSPLSLLRSTLNRSGCLAPLRRPCLQTTSGVAGVARRWQSTDRRTEEGKSFKGQLYESTAQRLEKERAERAKYSRERSENSQGRNLAFSFVVVGTAIAAYYFGTLSQPKPSTASTVPLATTKPVRHNTSKANMEAAWADFANIVGKENVSTVEDDLFQHSGSDFSSHQRRESERPFMIVYPASTEEVSKIMKVCHSRLIPVTGYSGGTSLEGHTSPTRGGIVVDFGRMDKILAVHKEDMDVVVQPAVGWETLNEELASDNLFFPPDPGPGAMIGGMVGTGCSGTNAYRYGTMREWVISLTVVLADGTVLKTRQRPRKSSAGYDLTKLFIGSEGTLGLVTEATLKLTTRPNTTSVAVCSFGSVREAADCVAKVVNEGVPIAAIEILDKNQMHALNAARTTKRTWPESSTLFFKFAGTPNAVKEQIGIVRTLAKSAGSNAFEFAKNAQEQEELWSARKEALWSVIALKQKPDDFVWTTDVAVPISRLPEIVDETQKEMAESGLFSTIVGHVGDGNFHALFLYSASQRPVAERIIHKMVKRAIELEGTVTGEHGVGLVKRDYLEHELGAPAVDAMRKIKLAFDPLCLLNCDKVVRVEKPKPGEIEPW